MENTIGNKSRSKFLLLASVLLFLLVILFVLMISSQKKQPAPVETPLTDNTAPAAPAESTADFIGNIAQKAKPAPQAQFATWSGLAAPASLPTNALVYKFKDTFSYNDAATLARKLATDASIQRQENMVMAYSYKNDGKDTSVLAYDTSTGTFTYNSTTGVALPGSGGVEAQATEFVKTLGIYDPTIKVSGTYKNKSAQGLVFVEMHRAWDSTKLPILNPMGLLNIPDSVSLASIQGGKSGEQIQSSIDSNVYMTSDNTDGLARSNDFNTVTVGIDEATQKVKMIRSNVRVLAVAAPQSTAILSFNDAVAKLKAGQQEMLLNTPQGSGPAMPWERIYPDNKAVADNAEVKEVVIAYLEQPPFTPQAALEPYYIIRGTAKLTSGYTTKFIAAVKATGKAMAMADSNVAGVYAAEIPGQGGQQQSTFKMTPLPTRGSGNNGTPEPTIPQTWTNPDVQSTGDQTKCNPSVNQLNPIVSVNINGTDYFFGYGPRGDRPSNIEWHYIPTQSTITQDSVLIANIGNIVNYLQQAVGQSGVQGVSDTSPLALGETNNEDTGQKQSSFHPTIEPTITFAVTVGAVPELDKIRKFDKIIKEVQQKYDYCPIRLTGSSPSVFVYGAEGTQFSVTPQVSLTYAEPATSTGWSGVIRNGGLQVENTTRDYLYYEYANASFNRPAAGWNVKKSEISTLVRSVIASAAGFNATETERAIFELNHAAASVSAETVFVAPIDQAQVDHNVPVSVSPAGAHVQRYHFYVGKAGASAQEPALKAVSREGVSVVEIGSYAAK